jgi:hypothetical protein
MRLATDAIDNFEEEVTAPDDAGPEDVALGAAEDDVEVPFICFASAWNAPKLFGPDSTALIEKTMPAPQWPR